nr:LysM peptidoglycan-binding domain-containing protein [Kingella kingae]
MRLPNFSIIYVLAISLLLSACSGVSNNTASGSCNAPSTGFYSVKAGDNLYRIGQRYGVSVANLKSWNQLSGDHIRAGQMLRVQKSTARSIHQKQAACNHDFSADACGGRYDYSVVFR